MLVLAAVDSCPPPHAEQTVAWLEQNLPPGTRLQLLMCVPHHELEVAKQACQARFKQPTEVVSVRGGSSDDIGTAILGRARAVGADMLAIAPHTRTAKQRVLQGSVTDYVCRHARLPVLVVQGAGGRGATSDTSLPVHAASAPRVSVAAVFADVTV
ncbi:hypothetical protein ABPG77_003893 [Micractinium sp. CCAP 211/92]